MNIREFDGKPENYEDWEDSFIASLRLLKLHLAFPKYISLRPAGFDLEASKQTIYDYLANVVDKNSRGIIRRGAPDDGVKALTLLRKHYLRDDDFRVLSQMRALYNAKIGERSVNEYLSFIDETVEKLKVRSYDGICTLHIPRLA